MAERYALPSFPLRVLELYSGIGGMHWAIKRSGCHCDVVTAIDINTSANAVYRHNFPLTNLLASNILGLNAKLLRELRADVWTISPPCQPYTRVGKKLDLEDERSNSFLHILTLLRELSLEPDDLPKYILLENVKGFDLSNARHQLVATLSKANFCYRELLLSPVQFGIPNSRLRYYMLAKLKPLYFQFKDYVHDEPWIDWPDQKSRDKIIYLTLSQQNKNGALSNGNANYSTKFQPIMSINMVCAPISEFLQKTLPPCEFYLLTPPTLQKYGKILDIVYPQSTHSCCFTRAYFTYILGTGSVLQTKNASLANNEAYEMYSKDIELHSNEAYKRLLPLGLRYFTPREVANLMCFPSEFKLSDSLSDKQHYKLLGNSINIHVVAMLLKYLFLF